MKRRDIWKALAGTVAVAPLAASVKPTMLRNDAALASLIPKTGQLNLCQRPDLPDPVDRLLRAFELHLGGQMERYRKHRQEITILSTRSFARVGDAHFVLKKPCPPTVLKYHLEATVAVDTMKVLEFPMLAGIYCQTSAIAIMDGIKKDNPNRILTAHQPLPLPGTGSVGMNIESETCGAYRILLSYDAKRLAQLVTFDILYGIID